MRTANIMHPDFENQPLRLTSEDTKDLYGVLDDFFSNFHLQDMREHLWDWLVTAMSTESGAYSTGFARSNLIFIYEKLELLIEAAHLISRKQKRRDYREALPFNSEFINKNCLRKLTERCTFLRMDEWESLIKRVVQIGKADQIYLVDYSPSLNSSALFDLLAVRTGKDQHGEKKRFAIPQTVLHCEYSMVWTEHESRIRQLMREDHLFFSAVCRPQNLLYDTGKLQLPEIEALNMSAIKAKAQTVFDSIQVVATSFLAGAQFYTGGIHAGVAAFMLHQTAVHNLRAILHGLTPYDKSGQNLEQLLELVRNVAPELCEVFPRNNVKEEEIFTQINTAYAPVKHGGPYRIGELDLKVLMDRVSDLHLRAKQVFERRLIGFEKSLTQS